MDYVLPEIVVEIAKHLMPRDLLACSSVSLHWREAFGSNEVWKRLCDPELEEHLRTTPCVVEPTFSVLFGQDASLTPLSQWRLAFQREQHLWRNWRKGNFKTVEHEVEAMKTSLEKFVTNNFIVSFDLYSVELWDVRPIPPVKVDSLLFGRKIYYNPSVFGDSLVVIKSHYADVFQILEVNVNEGTISLKYQFCFNKTTGTPELVCSSDPLFSEQCSLDSFDIIITKELICIGYFWFSSGSDSFHVWDLKSGAKLKKESCPTTLLGGGVSVVGCTSGSELCDDVLVVIPVSVDSQPSGRAIVSIECQVYNAQQLKFYSFKQTFSVFPEFLSDSTQSFDLCAITNNFVALTDCCDNDIKSIRIFNYKTGDELFMLEASSHVQVVDGSCFLFANQKHPYTEEEEVRLCSVFCPSGGVVKDVTGLDIENFDVVGNQLVEVVSLRSVEVWRIHKMATFKTAVTFPEFKEVNQACTKLISDKTVEDVDSIRISYFW